MNYLAHLFLSGQNPEVMAGNFMADAIKGKAFLVYPPEIQMGIKLHRFIDEHTDTHPVNERLREVLRSDFGRYAGVAVDLMYDHFLARQWNLFHSSALTDYTRDVYETLDVYSSFFSSGTRFMYGYMKRDNWLVNYQHLKGMDFAFRGLSSRIRVENTLFRGKEVLIEKGDAIKMAFDIFFPDLIEASTKKLNNLRLNSM